MVETTGHQPQDPFNPSEKYNISPPSTEAFSPNEENFREIWEELTRIVMSNESIDQETAGNKAFNELKHIFISGKWSYGGETQLLRKVRLDALSYSSDRDELIKRFTRVMTALEAIVGAFPEHDTADLWQALVDKIDTLDLGQSRQSRITTEEEYLFQVAEQEREGWNIADLQTRTDSLRDFEKIELRNLLDRQRHRSAEISRYVTDANRLTSAKQYLTMSLAVRLSKAK